MIKGIAHNALKVADMEKSLHFYCDILGLKKAFETNNDKGEPWIVYLKVADGAFIELFYGGTPYPEGKYAGDLIGYHHFCLETDDIFALAQRLQGFGIIDKAEPGLGRDTNHNLWIHDPDGNAVEIVQYSPTSFHMKSNR